MWHWRRWRGRCVGFSALYADDAAVASAAVNPGDPAVSLTADLTNVSWLRLVTTAAANEHTDWAAPALACGSATPNDPVEPVDRTLFSFESGADGFTIANPGDGGTVAQSTAFHTDGEHGLQVSTPLGGNWYGAQSLFDLTGTSMLKDCPAGVTFDPAEVHAVWVPERRRGLPRRRSG